MSDVETKQITNLDDFMEVLPFVVDAVKVLPRISNELDDRTVVDAIRKGIFKPDYAIWVQRRQGRPVLFCSAFIGNDIYGMRAGFLWMLRALPGADTKTFRRDVVLPWFRKQGVNRFIAVNNTFTDAKRRWLNSQGMKLGYEVFIGEL